MRVAAIDIGTNSVLLTVAERAADRSVHVLVDRATVTRLGAGVDSTRRLAPDAMARTLECLQAYAASLRPLNVDRLTVVGTSALRDAGDASYFAARAAEILQVAPRIISGTVEAELTFRGALSGLSVVGPVVVVDIGGGSTEVINGHSAPSGAVATAFRSVDVGCVRLTERHVSTDPPTKATCRAIAEDTRTSLRSLGFPVHGGTLVAVAGTATTLAAIKLGLDRYDPAQVHGLVLSKRDLDDLVACLVHATLAERSRMKGIDPRRADVMVAGSIMLAALIDEFGHTQVTVSDRGVRFGLIESMLDAVAHA